MKSIGQDTIFYKISFLCWRTLIIIFIIPCFANKRAVVNNGKGVDPETFANNHNFPHFYILINKISFAQMPKGLVDKDTAKFGINNNGILTPCYWLCRKEINCAFGY